MSKSIYCIGKKVGEEMVMKVCEQSEDKTPAKRVSIVSIKMVRESSILYDVRKIASP
jgi:DNA repair protein RadC